MSLVDELQKLNKKGVNEHGPAPVEAIILRVRAGNTYDIKFKNGAVARSVAGSLGYNFGDSVLVIIYPGKQKRYVITGKSYRSIGSLTIVEV